MGSRAASASAAPVLRSSLVKALQGVQAPTMLQQCSSCSSWAWLPHSEVQSSQTRRIEPVSLHWVRGCLTWTWGVPCSVFSDASTSLGP